MKSWLNLLAGICIVALGTSGARAAQAADLVVVSSMGAVSGLSELAPALRNQRGQAWLIA
jgi:hypothetical protein